MNTAGEGRLYGVAAEFSSAAAIYHAAEKVRDKGFRRWDVHTPFPIHGMDDAMGLGRSRLSFWSLMGACLGFATAFLMIYLTSADYALPHWLPSWLKQTYPQIVHGKPFFAIEPSVPILFELSILATAFFTVGALLVMNLLPRWNHPLFNWNRFGKVTDDGFFLVIQSDDVLFSKSETPKLLEELGGGNITMVRE